jgi:hypothetical protein
VAAHSQLNHIEFWILIETMDFLESETLAPFGSDGFEFTEVGFGRLSGGHKP